MVIRIKIQYLYLKKCPHWKEGLKVLNATLTELKIKDKVKLVEVKNNNQAQKLNFIGSPTIRVEDLEVDRFPEELAKQIESLKISGWREILNSAQGINRKPGLICRRYKFKDKYFDYPPKGMIEYFIKNIAFCLEIESCCK